MTACLTARIEPLEPLMVRAPGGWFWMGCEKKKGVRFRALRQWPGHLCVCRQASALAGHWLGEAPGRTALSRQSVFCHGRSRRGPLVCLRARGGGVTRTCPREPSGGGHGPRREYGGEKLPGPKALHAHLERLQRLSRWHGQKQGTSQTSAFMSSAAS